MLCIVASRNNMKAFDVDLVTSPIKIGFCISVNDPKKIRKAMETASAYWGGFQHCLIPTFSKLDKLNSWQRISSRRVSGEDITDGYLEVFSPDFLSYQNKKDIRLNSKIEEVSTQNLLKGAPYPIVEYGISLVEGLNRKITELSNRSAQNRKIPLLVSDGSSPVLNAFLLRPRSGFHNALKKDCDKTGIYEITEVNSGNYLRMFSGDFQSSLISISRSYLETSQYSEAKTTYLYCDSKNWLDAVHLWNMRAFGYRVFPIFVDQFETEEDLSMIYEFMINNCPRKIDFRGDLPKGYISESLTKDRATKFFKRLSEKGRSRGFQVVSNTWSIPRYWHSKENTERKNQIRSYYYTKEKREMFTEGSFLGIAIKCPNHDKYPSSKPSFKVECDVRCWGSDSYAEVYPEASVQGYPDILFRNNKITIMARAFQDRVMLPIMDPDIFVKEFLKAEHIECSVSQPGQYLIKMMKSAKGIHRNSPLFIKGMLEFLYEIDKTESKAVSGGIKKLLNKATLHGWTDAKLILKMLVEQKALKMLVQLKCPNCNQKFEVSFGELKEEMLCATCFEKFDDHSSDPDNMTFVYSRAGVFSLPRKSYGVPVVYLTLAFFRKCSDVFLAMNNGTSYNILIDEKKREVDLITFVSAGECYDKRIRPVFGECKFNCDFQKSDIELFERIEVKFRDSIFVFSTMKESLSAREKALLAKFAKKLRRKYKKGVRGSNLLILTSNELEKIGSNWDLWEKGYKNFINREMHTLGYLDSNCFVSQNKYLGLDLREVTPLSEPIPISFIL